MSIDKGVGAAVMDIEVGPVVKPDSVESDFKGEAGRVMSPLSCKPAAMSPMLSCRRSFPATSAPSSVPSSANSDTDAQTEAAWAEADLTRSLLPLATLALL
eukprot:CAMPEP_0173293592 /NCGR_PEP_ID=MMETSP1143-20121109/13391_1 /TAXON_ID=483371 /ORGANISM="non described non described, Strain CCMP2298" /LENGTH=100 /DNA_ID=CAMNT_0014233151 /DNA_START=288 /DNA_END=586 /DNA_ORIENTATION=-